MPDLRDDLGRLADFVGEPQGLDDLAAARRRRERRRRAEGLVAGIAVVLAVAVFLVSSFRSDPTSVRARRHCNANERVRGPDGAVSVAGELGRFHRRRCSRGDDSLRWRRATRGSAWRLDPEQVVQTVHGGGARLVRRVRARSAVWGRRRSGGESHRRAPDGGCDPSMVETIRVDRLSASGAWVVTSVGGCRAA